MAAAPPPPPPPERKDRRKGEEKAMPGANAALPPVSAEEATTEEGDVRKGNSSALPPTEAKDGSKREGKEKVEPGANEPAEVKNEKERKRKRKSCAAASAEVATPEEGDVRDGNKRIHTSTEVEATPLKKKKKKKEKKGKSDTTVKDDETRALKSKPSTKKGRLDVAAASDVETTRSNGKGGDGYDRLNPSEESNDNNNIDGSNGEQSTALQKKKKKTKKKGKEGKSDMATSSVQDVTTEEGGITNVHKIQLTLEEGVSKKNMDKKKGEDIKDEETPVLKANKERKRKSKADEKNKHGKDVHSAAPQNNASTKKGKLDVAAASDEKTTTVNGKGGNGSTRLNLSEESNDENKIDGSKNEQSPAQTESQPRTLFVGNIPYHSNAEQVISLFARQRVDVSDYMFPCHGGTSRGFGYVECATIKDADSAIERLNEYVHMGQPLSVERSYQSIHYMRTTQSPAIYGVGRTVMVLGLDKSTEDHIKKSIRIHFAECDITHIRVLINEGKAFLDLKDHDSFSKALDLDGSSIDGRQLKVIDVKPNPRTGPGFVCVLCGDSGITCMTCGTAIGGKGNIGWVSRAKTVAQGGSYQAGGSNQAKSSSHATSAIYVAGLDRSKGKGEIETLMSSIFGSCGVLKNTVVPQQPDGTTKGFCFIYFEHEEAAKQAKKFHGHQMNGMKLIVKDKR